MDEEEKKQSDMDSLLVPDMIVKSSQLWDVKFASSRTIGRRKPRRICLQVIRKNGKSNNFRESGLDFGADNNESFASDQNELMKTLLSGNKAKVVDMQCTLNPDEKVVMKIYKLDTTKKNIYNTLISKKNKVYGHEDEDSINSISTMGLYGIQDEIEEDNWVERYSYDLEDISIVSRVKKSVEVRFRKRGQQLRCFIMFDSGSESKSFFEHVFYFQKKSIKQHKENHDVMQQPTDVLIEICSAWDLRLEIENIHRIRFQCIVYRGNDKIHETDYVSSTIVPVWTILTDSTFLFSAGSNSIREAYSGLSFHLIMIDEYENSSELGKITIKRDTIFKAKKGRLELQLLNGNQKSGKLGLRLRKATEDESSTMGPMDAESSMYSFASFETSTSFISDSADLEKSDKSTPRRNTWKRGATQFVTQNMMRAYRYLNIVPKCRKK